MTLYGVHIYVPECAGYRIGIIVKAFLQLNTQWEDEKPSNHTPSSFVSETS
jgi:hypothetical protein